MPSTDLAQIFCYEVVCPAMHHNKNGSPADRLYNILLLAIWYWRNDNNAWIEETFAAGSVL